MLSCVQKEGAVGLDRTLPPRRKGFGSIIPVDRSSLTKSSAKPGIVSGECHLTHSHEFLVSLLPNPINPCKTWSWASACPAGKAAQMPARLPCCNPLGLERGYMYWNPVSPCVAGVAKFPLLLLSRTRPPGTRSNRGEILKSRSLCVAAGCWATGSGIHPGPGDSICRQVRRLLTCYKY